MMRGGIMLSDWYRPAYDLKTSWANKPAANTLPNGTIVRMDGSDGLFKGFDFVVQAGYYYPRGGRATMYDGGNMRALTYSSATLGTLAGLSTPTFPMLELCAVPGARFRSYARMFRTTPSSGQQTQLYLYIGAIMLARRNVQDTNNMDWASGETAYSPNANKHYSSPVGTNMFSVGTINAGTEDTVTNAPLTIQIQSGAGTETNTMWDCVIEYLAGAFG